jgi:ribosomal protein L11 methyltransferase
VLRLSFHIPGDQREDVLDGILPLLPAGIVERELGDGMVELSTVGGAAALPSRGAIEAAAGRALAEWRAEPVPADWRERRGLLGGGAYAVDGRLVVRSPWDPPSPPGVIEVVIDRGGSAFGSGSHPTTQMSLALLLDLEPSGGAVDLGCGAGTLAIAAAKLGWAPVTGIDRSGEAVEGARENAAANGVEMECVHADLGEAPFPARALVLANAPPPVHERAAAALGDEARHVIVSGIVESELDAVRAMYAAAGFAPARGMAADMWVAVLMERADG